MFVLINKAGVGEILRCDEGGEEAGKFVGDDPDGFCVLGVGDGEILVEGDAVGGLEAEFMFGDGAALVEIVVRFFGGEQGVYFLVVGEGVGDLVVEDGWVDVVAAADDETVLFCGVLGYGAGEAGEVVRA